jgi:hypothetical protein
MDSQSVKTSTNMPLTSQGIDPGKKIVGRKRNILADSIGLLLAVIVTAASTQDHATGALLLGTPPPPTPPCTRSGSTAATAR